MEPSLLSVIELGPLPYGNLAVSTSVRTVEEFDRSQPPPSLTCLFEEPSEATVRMRIGAVQLDSISEPNVLEKTLDDPGIWLGCLSRLTRAGDALKSQDVNALVAAHASTESIWFEVEPCVGSWRPVDAQRVRQMFADVTINARTKPFFVHAVGSQSAVRDMLLALCNGSTNETPDS